ncbi:hypothetical protein KH5H1_18690 [Corallococcus caeni]|nr:hypothetical protein KH5H1_18690 [Corallococcus sp. KH5-1]
MSGAPLFTRQVACSCALAVLLMDVRALTRPRWSKRARRGEQPSRAVHEAIPPVVADPPRAVEPRPQRVGAAEGPTVSLPSWETRFEDAGRSSWAGADSSRPPSAKEETASERSQDGTRPGRPCEE